MAAPNSAQLAREAKTFAVNASRTPETMALIRRALEQYAENMSTWLKTHTDEDQVLSQAWITCYDEWRATWQTLEALGAEHT